MRRSRKPRRRLRLARLLLVLVATLATAGAVYGLHAFQTQRNAGGTLARADAAVSAGDLPAAARLYKSYVRMRPADADAVGRYAAALDALRDTQPAVTGDLVEVYERLLRLDPARAADRRKLARLHVRGQAFPNARSHLNTLLNTSPDDPELHDLLAQCDERERNFAAAAGHLRKVVAAPDASPDAVVRLAVLVRTELGGPDPVAEADGLLNGLVSRRPTDRAAWLARAAYRRRFNDKAGARQDAQHVYQSLPGGADDPDVLQTLSDLLLDADDLPADQRRPAAERAEGVLRQAASGPAAHTRTRLALADLQIRLGRLDTARQTLAAAADRSATVDVPLLEVVDRLIDLKELTLAGKQAERFAGFTAAGPVPDYLRGRLALAAGDWAAATPLLQAAADGLTQLVNQRYRAFLGLAEAARQANDPQARLDAFDAALRVNPASDPARLGRAESLARLGRRKEAEEAFRGLAGADPAARAAVANLRLAEELAKPPADRRWEAVDSAFGADPLPAEVAVVKARSLAARGRVADAVRVLDAASGDSPLPDVVVDLAQLKAATGDRAGAFAVLDRAAAREVFDLVPFRLARARLLVGNSPPDWPAVAALGDPSAIGQLTRDDRYTLLAGLAGLHAAGGKPAEAVALWQRAAAERPADLLARAALFDLALATNDAPLQAELLAEFERIEGPNGPVRTAAEAAQAVPKLKPNDPALAGWRDRLLAARAKRGGWGLVHHLLGRVEALAGNADAAAEALRRAFDLGERSDGLLRELYAALVGRQRYAEAFEVLSRADRERPLPADLGKELLRLQVAFGDDPARAEAWATSPEAVNSASDADHLLRADALLAANKPAAAVEPLKKAVGLNPVNAVAWVALTRVLVAVGKESEAKAAATDAGAKLDGVKEPPAARAAALVAAGQCQEVVGDRPAAEAAYRQAAAADPADVSAHAAVARLLARTGRAADADTYLRGLADAPPAVRRWGRRELAFAVLDRPDWYGRLPAAVTLLDQNLRDGGDLPEDVRARAVLVGADPLRAGEAAAVLAESARAAPLTADQSYQLARLYVKQNDPAKAEAALRDAVRAAPVPAPEVLALLVRVQVTGGAVAAARQTVDRLKKLDPKGLLTAVADARVLAAEGQKPQAAGRLAAAAPTDPVGRVGFVGPLLEEFGCAAEAEAEYRTATDPLATVRLAAFFLRRKQPADVVRTLLPGDGKAPAGLAARLLAGAVRSNPPQLLPEPERSNWEKTVREVSAWLTARLLAAPTDPHLLAAVATLETVTGRPDGVVPAFERALAAAPDDPTAKANLAFARAVYGRDGSDATLALVQAAIDAGGPAPALLDTRGLVHVVAGRAELAIKDLSTAAGLEPKPAFLFHLAQAYDLQAADKPEYAKLRDATLADAGRRGLTKAVLDPREWPEFERLTRPGR